MTESWKPGEFPDLGELRQDHERRQYQDRSLDYTTISDASDLAWQRYSQSHVRGLRMNRLSFAFDLQPVASSQAARATGRRQLAALSRCIWRDVKGAAPAWVKGQKPRAWERRYG